MTVTIVEALQSLRPNAEWSLRGNGLFWADSVQTEPTREEIQAKIQELQAAEPLRLLRIERTRLLQECDWRDLPSYPGTDQEEWRTYRQALRDLPNNSEPQLNDAGELINIVWPEKPNGGA